MKQFALKLTLLSDSTPYFGPGVRDLFRLIDEKKSVKEAASAMNLSYSKAWKMIKSVEQGTGREVVSRTHGGKDGGNAFLTEDGKKILKEYEEFEERAKKETERIFSDIFRE